MHLAATNQTLFAVENARRGIFLERGPLITARNVANVLWMEMMRI